MTPINGKGGPAQAAQIPNRDSVNHTTRPPKRICCRYHCGSCGRHFASLDSFDSHRRGSFSAPIGTFEGRHCTAPDIAEKFEPALGVCKISGAHEQLGQTIWRLPAAAARVGAHFKKSGDQALEAVTA